MAAWSREQASRFLERRSGQRDSEAALALAAALGCLPLALEQAGAYAEASGKSLAAYLELFRRQRIELLEADGIAGGESSVVTTWALSFQRVAAASPAAEQLMRLCAFFAPDDIPLEMLAAAPERLPAPLARCVESELALDEALAVLLRYSLVARGKGTVSVHRLVQAVVRHDLGSRREVWAGLAVELLARSFPSEGFAEVGVWPLCARLLPHALAGLRRGGDVRAGTAQLLDAVGSYLHGRGQFEEARGMLERAAEIEAATHGADDLRVATRVNDLGRVLIDLGELDQARRQFERALAIEEAALGPAHPNVASRLNNIAATLMDLGEFGRAKLLFERALEIDRAVQGEPDLRVGIRLLNLGIVHTRLGKFEIAESYFASSLRIQESQLGGDDPRLARSLNSYGGLCFDRNELERAREFFLRALRIQVRSLGSDHPDLAIPLKNLGEVFMRWRQPARARGCLEKALAIETATRDRHPELGVTRELLGRLALAEGRPAEARRQLSAALEHLESTLGPEHPTTGRVRERLAALADSG